MLRILVVVAAIVACVASATPYQSSGFRGGFTESSLGPDTWSIRVKVNSYTDAGTAMEYGYRRAGELCPGGFDVVDGTQQQVDRYVVTGNVISNQPKTNLSLIVRCRSAVVVTPGVGARGQSRPAPLAPPLPPMQ